MKPKFITKGKGKDAKHIPINNKKGIRKSSFNSKTSKTKSNYRIPTLPNDPPKFKLPEDEYIIRSNNYSMIIDKDGINLGLYDFGWSWSGDENDINTFMERIALNEDVAVKFEEDLRDAGLDFEKLKPIMLKSLSGKLDIENDDGIYVISGDNSRWKFANDTDFIDTGSEFDYASEELDLFPSEKEAFEDEFWQNFSAPTYEEFFKSNSKWINDRLKEIIKESENLDDYMSGIENLREGVDDAYREMEMENTIIATNKTAEEIKARRSEAGIEQDAN